VAANYSLSACQCPILILNWSLCSVLSCCYCPRLTTLNNNALTDINRAEVKMSKATHERYEATLLGVRQGAHGLCQVYTHLIITITTAAAAIVQDYWYCCHCYCCCCYCSMLLMMQPELSVCYYCWDYSLQASLKRVLYETSMKKK
jgi:hypothetical protein